jgi:hypothetical protein
MDDYNVNIFNQNYILIKIIKILVEKYSLLKYDKRSVFGMLVNHNLDNDFLFEDLSGIKISRILFDKKTLDNIKKIISMVRIFCFGENNENDNYPSFKDKPEQNSLCCAITLDNIKKIISINYLLVKTFQKLLLNNVKIRKFNL